MFSRSTLFLLLSACALPCFGAPHEEQEQDRKLIDRLQRPNMNLKFDASQGTFGKPTTYSASRKVVDKGAFGTRDFISHDFSTKTSSDVEKKSWFASLFFSTKKAGTEGRYEIPNAGQAYNTKAAATKDAYFGSKTAATSAYVNTDLQYLKRNRFDASPNKTASNDPSNLNKPIGYTGDLRPMTIDDVRELLNKNK